LQECAASMDHAVIQNVLTRCGYQSSRIGRSTGNACGGVVLLVAKRLQMQPIPEKQKPIPFLDEVWVTICPAENPAMFSVKVGGFYVRQTIGQRKLKTELFAAMFDDLP